MLQVTENDVLGYPRQFKISLLTDDGFASVNHQSTFTPAEDAWQTELPLAESRASFRGRAVAGAPPLAPACIRQVGLMTVAAQVGLFALHIRRGLD